MEQVFDMFSINSIRSMEIIDFNRGKKIGVVSDIKLDMEEGKIISLMLPIVKGSWFSKTEWYEIPWERVVKVGEDIILVDINLVNDDESQSAKLYP